MAVEGAWVTVAIVWVFALIVAILSAFTAAKIVEQKEILEQTRQASNEVCELARQATEVCALDNDTNVCTLAQTATKICERTTP